MLLRAKIRSGFLGRLALIAMFCLGGSLWFLYDAAIGYPAQRQRALEYQRLKEDEGLDNADRRIRWVEIAKERGWPDEIPGNPKSDTDIYKQYFFAVLVAVPALLYAFFFLRACRRWIELNDSGLRTSWGRQLEFGQIVTLNKKKWKTKGIAKISYKQNGRKRRLVLDDWKYNTEATKAILCEVESRIDVGQIVGGPPEPPPEQEQSQEDVD